MEEVRKLLRRWREGRPTALLSHDNTHLYYTIDYTPPEAGGAAVTLIETPTELKSFHSLRLKPTLIVRGMWLP